MCDTEFVVFTDCEESCARPISTNPVSMEAGEYGLTRGTCFFSRRFEVVAVAGLMWVSWRAFGGAGFFRARAIHDRWLRETQSSQQLGEGAPTVSQPAHRELTPTYPHQVCRLVCSRLRNMACHQVLDHQSSSHQPKPTSLILELSNFKHFFKLRERQSRLLASRRTPADNRKRDVEACVLTPSISKGRCVGAL